MLNTFPAKKKSSATKYKEKKNVMKILENQFFSQFEKPIFYCFSVIFLVCFKNCFHYLK